MTGGLLSRMQYCAAEGAHYDETRRYMMIRPDALMGIFRLLPPEARAQALEAFADSIQQQGGDSARAYVAMGGGAGDGGAALAQTIVRTAPELGWGIWDMDLHDGGIDLTVRNSPFAAGFGGSPDPVCHPIKGMLRAVGEIVLGGPVLVVETACAACGAPECRFTVRRAQPEGRA